MTTLLIMIKYLQQPEFLTMFYVSHRKLMKHQTQNSIDILEYSTYGKSTSVAAEQNENDEIDPQNEESIKNYLKFSYYSSPTRCCCTAEDNMISIHLTFWLCRLNNNYN